MTRTSDDPLFSSVFFVVVVMAIRHLHHELIYGYELCEEKKRKKQLQKRQKAQHTPQIPVSSFIA
jgi:hypothetical protein